MADVVVTLDAADPEKILLHVSGVPAGPTRRPKFRLYSPRLRQYASDRGFQPMPFDFAWHSTREGHDLEFVGQLSVLRWLDVDEQLTLQIPEVPFSQPLKWLAVFVAPAPSPSPLTPPPPRPPDTMGEVAPAAEPAGPRLTPELPPAMLLSMSRQKRALPALLLGAAAVWFAADAWLLLDTRSTSASLEEKANALHQRDTEIAAGRADLESQRAQLVTQKSEQARAAADFAAQKITLRSEQSNLLQAQRKLDEDRRALETAKNEVARAGTAQAELTQARMKLDDERRALESAKADIAKAGNSQAELAQARLKLDDERRALESAKAEVARAGTAQSDLTQARLKLEEERRQFERDKAAAPVSCVVAMPPGTCPAPPPAPAASIATPADPGGECDQLAANPNDADRRNGTGISYGQLAKNADAAVAACERAVAAAPTQARYQYQLGRSLQAKNPDLARQHFETAARANYPAAFDNLGNLAIQLDRDYQKATGYYRRGIALKDVDAMITMADLMLKRLVPGTPVEAAFLYYQAADNGHANAKRVVARVSGINYAELSRILVQEANR